MIKEIKYKLQGKGTDNEFDSWVITYNNENTPPNIVYTDPSIVSKMDISNVDIDTLDSNQIEVLKTKLGLL